jgi:ABC-2 type transport system permease protein
MKTIFFNIVAIYRRELQSYFGSALAYTIAGVFWLLAGILFQIVFINVLQQVALLDVSQSGPPPAIDVPYEIISAVFGVMGSLTIAVLPFLSMGLYAEERKRGTLELLATSPLTNWSVAIGKLLGVFTFFMTISLPILMYLAIALANVNPAVQPNVLFLAYAGLLLLAASVLSLGMFMSSLTDSTILAAIFTFALIAALWVVDAVANIFGGGLRAVLGHLSLMRHFTNLSQGVIDTSSLALFASYIVLGIFLTAQSVEALRFQRS